MYHIQIGINISSEAKTDFIVNELIPFLEEHVKDNYYFTRSVNVIPVIDLYLNTSDIKITYIYSKIQSILINIYQILVKQVYRRINII